MLQNSLMELNVASLGLNSSTAGSNREKKKWCFIDRRRFGLCGFKGWVCCRLKAQVTQAPWRKVQLKQINWSGICSWWYDDLFVPGEQWLGCTSNLRCTTYSSPGTASGRAGSGSSKLLSAVVHSDNNIQDCYSESYSLLLLYINILGFK